MGRTVALLLGVALVGGTACERAADPGASAAPLAAVPAPKPSPPATDWNGRSLALHVDEPTGLRFAVPAAGYRVEVEHFPRGTPPHKLKDTFTVAGKGGPAVTVDVWRNDERLPLEAWFERHLGFMRADDAVVSTTVAGRSRVAAILVEQPRSPQASARLAAVFAVGPHVLRVTCLDRDVAENVAAWERLLESVSVGGAP